MDTVQEKYFLTRGKAILAGLILITVIIVFIVIKTGGARSVEKYKDFENELKAAAESYYDINSIDIEDGEIKRLSMNKKYTGAELLRKYREAETSSFRYKWELLDEIERFVHDFYDDYNIVFRPYIKCGRRYMTSNYSEY